MGKKHGVWYNTVGGGGFTHGFSMDWERDDEGKDHKEDLDDKDRT